MTGESGDYEVGYKKPPKHTRWKKGQRSPNPSGRPRQLFDVVTIIDRVFGQVVTVRTGERVHKITVEEAAELAQMNRAMEGDQAAFCAVIKKMIRFKLEIPRPPGMKRGYLVVEPPFSEEEWERELARVRADYVHSISRSDP